MVDIQAYSEMVNSPAHFASYSPFRQCDPDCRLCIEGGVTWKGSLMLSPHYAFSLPYTRINQAMHKPSPHLISLKSQLLREGLKINVLFSRSISGVFRLTRLSWSHLNMPRGHPCVPNSNRLRTLHYPSMIVWEVAIFDTRAMDVMLLPILTLTELTLILIA